MMITGSLAHVVHEFGVRSSKAQVKIHMGELYQAKKLREQLARGLGLMTPGEWAIWCAIAFTCGAVCGWLGRGLIIR
jgi:hypothetical protein